MRVKAVAWPLRATRRSAKVAALTATTTLWSQEALAQTILGLVPETVPHISEMLDDDDSDEARRPITYETQKVR